MYAQNDKMYAYFDKMYAHMNKMYAQACKGLWRVFHFLEELKENSSVSQKFFENRKWNYENLK